MRCCGLLGDFSAQRGVIPDQGDGQGVCQRLGVELAAYKTIGFGLRFERESDPLDLRVLRADAEYDLQAVRIHLHALCYLA